MKPCQVVILLVFYINIQYYLFKYFLTISKCREPLLMFLPRVDWLPVERHIVWIKAARVRHTAVRRTKHPRVRLRHVGLVGRHSRYFQVVYRRGQLLVLVLATLRVVRCRRHGVVTIVRRAPEVVGCRRSSAVIRCRGSPEIVGCRRTPEVVGCRGQLRMTVGDT